MRICKSRLTQAKRNLLVSFSCHNFFTFWFPYLMTSNMAQLILIRTIRNYSSYFEVNTLPSLTKVTYKLNVNSGIIKTIFTLFTTRCSDRVKNFNRSSRNYKNITHEIWISKSWIPLHVIRIFFPYVKGNQLFIFIFISYNFRTKGI